MKTPRPQGTHSLPLLKIGQHLTAFITVEHGESLLLPTGNPGAGLFKVLLTPGC